MKLFFIPLILLSISLLWWNYPSKKTHISYNQDAPISFILFDFDGVIADSFDMAVTLCNQLADEYGFSKITDDQRLQLMHMPMKDIITKHLKIPWYRIFSFHNKIRTMAQKHMLEIPLVRGIDDVLKQLKNQGYRLGIISSNGEENIRRFLKHHNLDIFDVIDADSSLFGKHHVINRFLKKCNVHQSEVIYIGDEVRDIEAAQKSGIRIIAVSWGFNTYEALLVAQPDRIIAHPAKLLPVLNTFKK